MKKMLLSYLLWYESFSAETRSSFVSGPLEGLSCDSETVELANSAQLNSILSELSETTFFRLVRVGSEGFCPVESLRPAVDEATCGEVVDSFSSFAPVLEDISSPSLCSVQPEFSAQEVAEIVVKSKSDEELSAEGEFPRDNECVVEGSIRPDYWLDICTSAVGGSAEYVNLKLNPERNTGYNGSRVWAEMHASAALLEGIEGRILQKLLSGYHASVSTQIAWSYFPTSGSLWKPNYNRVVQPEHIENMQFAFVVLARSLFKLKDWLYRDGWAIVSTGNATADSQTRDLLRLLMDTSVLSACSSVSTGFDESLMFSTPTIPPSSLGKVATNFKKTFRRITKLVDCVTCHRCKLHASVAMHGIGTAIKILLTPRPDLVTASLSRDDLVALVNTVEKFSESIKLAGLLFVQHKTVPDHLLFIRDHANLTRYQEDLLVHAILKKSPEVEKLGRVFSGWKFVRHALIWLGILDSADTIVVGGGLAGLVVAISIADRGGSVLLIEKEPRLGGNSMKASSGINKESDASLLNDTLVSQGGVGNVALAEILTKQSKESVAWLERMSGVNLTSVTRLGGHSVPHTWRPEHGLVGAELMSGLIREVNARPSITVKAGTKVSALLIDADGAVSGVRASDEEIHGRNVVLTSGGFGFAGGGLLGSFRPDLVSVPTTLGPHTTGDGIRLAASAGADLVGMEYVQLHPTGFVDPRDPSASTKVLAGELLRGSGGVLLTQDGFRFVNELGTRKYIVDTMYTMEKNDWFWLVLSDKSANIAQPMGDMYVKRGLLQNVTDIPDYMHEALREYDEAEEDKFERNSREGRPLAQSAWWLVGKVVPVVHYTMGGVRVDPTGRVLNRNGVPIKGLFAAGEVTGGVHGENRLGGNSLLECTVFGRIIGMNIDLANPELEHTQVVGSNTQKPRPVSEPISINTVEKHATSEDCWTIIVNQVYDLSNYTNDHPGGKEAISENCGKNATNRFLLIHSERLLTDMGFVPIGIAVH